MHTAGVPKAQRLAEPRKFKMQRGPQNRADYAGNDAMMIRGRYAEIKKHCKKNGIPMPFFLLPFSSRARAAYAIFDAAFTHKSYAHGGGLPREPLQARGASTTLAAQPHENLRHNERLEFLGDAVLNVAITEYLMRRFPAESEGVLSRMKSYAVSRGALYQVARVLSLNAVLRARESVLAAIAARSEASNSEEDAKIYAPLANATEALIGAVYATIGMRAAKKFIVTHFSKVVDAVAAGSHFKDYKSMLQHYAQSVCSVKPVYKVVGIAGPDHEKRYRVSVELALSSGEKKVFEASEGGSKKEAEQNAARAACEALGVKESAVLF